MICNLYTYAYYRYMYYDKLRIIKTDTEYIQVQYTDIYYDLEFENMEVMRNYIIKLYEAHRIITVYVDYHDDIKPNIINIDLRLPYEIDITDNIIIKSAIRHPHYFPISYSIEEVINEYISNITGKSNIAHFWFNTNRYSIYSKNGLIKINNKYLPFTHYDHNYGKFKKYNNSDNEIYIGKGNIYDIKYVEYSIDECLYILDKIKKYNIETKYDNYYLYGKNINDIINKLKGKNIIRIMEVNNKVVNRDRKNYKFIQGV